MDDKRFIELAKQFLIYSFESIDFYYNYLTDEEKELVSEEEFELFVNKITGNDNK